MKEILIATLFVATFIDIRKKIIPNWLTVAGMIVGVSLTGIDGLLGLLTGGVILWITMFLCDIYLTDFTIGGGDVKLMAMVGAFVGVQSVLIIYLLSVALDVAFLGFLVINHKKSFTPFAPILSIATILSIMGGVV